MIKQFSIFKAKQSDNEKAPSHNISANVGTADQPEYVNIGACWTKDGKAGKFLSCKLQDVYVDHSDNTKCRKGFAIADEKLLAKQELDTPPEAPQDDLSPF